MLDPSKPKPLDLTDFTGYINSCLELAESRLKGCASLEQVAQAEDELNAYTRLGRLSEPRDIFITDEESITARDIERAALALLDGKVLLEHTCAGEATRLGLGTKYLLNPRLDLDGEVMLRLTGQDSWPVDPMDLTSMSLGRRHMLQLAWDLSRLAEDFGRDPDEVLKKQPLLIIVNEASVTSVEMDFLEAAYYGFDPDKVLFMVQKSFHGLNLGPDGWFYDNSSPRRLHNHGQMLMQTTMDGQLYRNENGNKDRLPWLTFRDLLGRYEDKISFNIEDLDYLSQSLDMTGLATALKLGDQGARMVMEVVTNNPENPQKGGACFWDRTLERNVMVESFQLKGLDPADIVYLNKNINHYPHPTVALSTAREQGLSMPISVKEEFLYFQPVQGDLNFLLPTAYMRRKKLNPIHSWKSGANTIAALEAMAQQEKRPGFLKWANELTGLKL
ncbi:MAG: hypothetical protein KKE29_12940 [Proteobacteria bacterium]|nr:hypothetical protein [Pseudomonadota bacterium]MBU4574650.1 hypothetical protein [Pseudomonadota bacterium]MBU4599060.1 hypothetical protein [Pseudomonadota bacterium]MBV1714887.1 hypothetical protein [Desulfarculus sp.]MBV1752623.1 hypothetical protein [Desulfarculus sp.]